MRVFLSRFKIVLLIAASIWCNVTLASDHEVSARAIAANIPHLNNTNFAITSLSGGLTNRMYKLETQTGNKYVMRVFGKEADSLGIDPVAQLQIAQRIAEIGVGPKVLYHTPDGRVWLIEFVTGIPLSQANYDPQLCELIMRKLQVFHEQGNIAKEFDVFATAANMQQIAVRKDAKTVAGLPVDKILLAREQVKLIEKIIRPHSDNFIRSAHNDFHTDNILYDPSEKKVTIIDLDYSGRGDLFFDLAILANNLNLNSQDSYALLASYFAPAKPTRRDEAHLAIMRLVSIYWNSMWCFSQVRSSSIEFDFKTSGQTYLEDFLAKMSLASFEEDLEILKHVTKT